MSTAVIVGIIISGLAILVAIAVTIQSIDKNNKEKRRLEAALKSRSRNFDYMLNGFPEGFLNRDLQVLVCNCLAEVYSQLAQIDSRNKDYSNKLSKAQMQLAEYKARPANNSSVTLTDITQIKEVQKMLGGLYNFIAKLAASKRITTKEAKIYGKQVRRLIVQTSTDALINPINDALQMHKFRLAIHYSHMAVDKMKKENDDGFYTDRINKYLLRIDELETQATSNEEEAETEKQKIAGDWEDIEKPDDSWKKNAVYD
jgi:predicted RND superfamily exporter protein